MKNNEVVFILDRSGSMSGKESDTIGGFNSVLKEQKENANDGDVLISTVLFDNEQEVLHDRKSINDIQEMTTKQYKVRGCTALLDALGGAINHIKMVHKYIREEDLPEHILFVIITDGLENASTQYSKKEVKKLVTEQQNKGWEFLFIGANIDSITTAESFGISADYAYDYCCDEIGNSLVYKGVSSHITASRKLKKGKANVKCAMKSVAADYKKRCKK